MILFTQVLHHTAQKKRALVQAAAVKTRGSFEQKSSPSTTQLVSNENETKPVFQLSSETNCFSVSTLLS